jgi:hypothetical protein
MKKYHYVYYSYESWGRGYIGKRTCKCHPQDDTQYFGSFSDKTFNPDSKIIIATFDTSEEALAAEIALHEFYDVAVNSHFANKAKQSSKFFNVEGIAKAAEHKEKIRLSNLGKKRSEESKRKMSEAKKGNTYGRGNKGKISCRPALGLKFTDEQRIRKALCGHKAKYRIEATSPDGISMCPLNIHLFCEEHGMSAPSLRAVAKGRGKFCKGWTARLCQPPQSSSSSSSP